MSYASIVFFNIPRLIRESTKSSIGTCASVDGKPCAHELRTEPSIDEGGPGARRRRGGCEERTPPNSYASTQLSASDARRMFVLYATPYKSLGQRKEEGAPLRRTVENMGARGKKGPSERSFIHFCVACIDHAKKKECVDGSDVIFSPPLFLLPVGNQKAHGWLMTFF